MPFVITQIEFVTANDVASTLQYCEDDKETLVLAIDSNEVIFGVDDIPTLIEALQFFARKDFAPKEHNP